MHAVVIMCACSGCFWFPGIPTSYSENKPDYPLAWAGWELFYSAPSELYSQNAARKIILNQMLTTRPLTPYRLLATTELYDLDHTHTAHMQNLSLSKTGISFSAIILLRGILTHTPQHTYTGVLLLYSYQKVSLH